MRRNDLRVGGRNIEGVIVKPGENIWFMMAPSLFRKTTETKSGRGHYSCPSAQRWR